MDKIVPNLWFDGNAEEAVHFYVGLIPNSRLVAIQRAPADNPSTAKGAVLVVEFELAGRSFTALNGGPQFPFTEAVSLAIDCADQMEVDRYWAALTADGGRSGNCGWCTDRFGLSWQVVPRRLPELLATAAPDAAERVMQALFRMHKIEIVELESAAGGGPIEGEGL